MNEIITRILRVVRMELKVGGIFECPEGHKAKIVWISEDKKVVAVECPQEHLRKIVNVNIEPAPLYRNQPREKKEIYLKNMVFIIKI
jgi:hypothetical protein